MGAVALSTPTTRTAADLFAAGLVLTISIYPAQVKVDCPAAIDGDVKAALGWRMTAMRAQWETRAPRTARPTLVAIHGGGTRGTGWCSSCDEAREATHLGGDCVLCNGARVAVLKAVGLLDVGTK